MHSNSMNEHMSQILKIASSSYYDFDKNGKIQAIEDAFDSKIEKEVAYMMATSHEYKKPNTKKAIIMTKNYKWEMGKEPLSKIQGINKPVIKEKVLNIAKNIKKPKPLIVVNQLHGLRPQTPGRKILLDGHHRLEAYEFMGLTETPVYKGTYTGASEIPIDQLINSN